MRSWLLVTLDSCRADSLPYAEVRTATATWTLPAHAALLSGQLPHAVPPGVVSVRAGDDLPAIARRLHLPEPLVRDAHLRCGLWLPRTLRTLGYAVEVITALPCLSPKCGIRSPEDRWVWAGKDGIDCLPAQLEALETHARVAAADGRPWFVLLNVGETHFPYFDGSKAEVAGHPLPRLSGLHGAAEGCPSPEAEWLLRPEVLVALRLRQQEAARRALATIRRAVQTLPAPTGLTVTVTADHGEAMGEGGTLGHGPVTHPEALEAVLRVPWVEWAVE